MQSLNRSQKQFFGQKIRLKYPSKSKSECIRLSKSILNQIHIRKNFIHADKLIECMVHYENNINKPNSNGDTPIMESVRGHGLFHKKSSEIEIDNLTTQCLLQYKNIDLKSKNSRGFDALWYATDYDNDAYCSINIKNIKLLIDYGVNLNVTYETKIDWYREEIDIIPFIDWDFFWSVCEKNIRHDFIRPTTNVNILMATKSLTNCQLLIESGINFRGQDSNGNDALMYAVLEGRLDKVKLLLNYGININVLNFRKETPLLVAVIMYRHYFRNHNVSYGNIESDHIKFIRCIEYHSIVDELLERGANSSIPNIDGINAKMVYQDCLKMMNRLNL